MLAYSLGKLHLTNSPNSQASESLGRFASKPKLPVQQYENANTALGFIQSRGIRLTNCGAEDIVKGNRKIVLVGLSHPMFEKLSSEADICFARRVLSGRSF